MCGDKKGDDDEDKSFSLSLSSCARDSLSLWSLIFEAEASSSPKRERAPSYFLPYYRSDIEFDRYKVSAPSISILYIHVDIIIRGGLY